MLYSNERVFYLCQISCLKNNNIKFCYKLDCESNYASQYCSIAQQREKRERERERERERAVMIVFLNRLERVCTIGRARDAVTTDAPVL